jgi:hypothetical protein
MFERAMASWGRLFGWGQAPATEDERRGWARHRCDVATTLHLAGDANGAAVPARVRDVSPGGASLVVGRLFDLGAMLSLALPHPAREPLTTVLVCVVHARDLGDGRWQLGCTFSAEITADDLERFAPQPGAARPEQRAGARHPGRAHAAYQRVNAPTPESSQARVLNLSIGGIVLEADAPRRSATCSAWNSATTPAC